MITINDIIPLINNSLSGHYFKDILFYNQYAKLLKQNSEDQLERPAIWEGSGNLRFIQEDTKGLICYHRVVDSESEDDNEGGFGKNPLTTMTYSMRVVFFGNRTAIDKDCTDINELLAKEFKSLLPRKMTLIDRNVLNPGKVYVNEQELAGEEGITWQPEMVLFAIDYEFKLTSTRNCDNLSCDSEVLAACKPATITDSDGVTTVEVASGSEFTCTPVVQPSGILYFPPPFDGESTSFRTGDTGWRYQQGWFDYNLPSNPAIIAQLATGSRTVLASNNAFGNTNRFTDENGLQVYGNNYIIDHHTGFGRL